MVWPGARPRYTYQLLFDDALVGPVKIVLDNETPGTSLTLEIPVNLLIEGIHKVAYQTKNPDSEVANESLETFIEVDLTAPGNPLLAPIIFPSAIQDGLTSAELDDMNNVLKGQIASYNDMKVGDVIRTYWNGVEGPLTVVDKDDMGLKRVVVEFSRSFLESIGDIEAPVHYTVTDLAGNLSMDSAAVMVKLLLFVLPELPLPEVKEANGDTLDPADAVNGATVVVGASAQLRRDDKVLVQWHGPKGSDSKEKLITEAGQALEMLFSPVLVEVNAGETVNVLYEVHRSNGVVQSSDTLFLKVLAALKQLPAPTMDTVGPDGLLIPDRIPESGATVRVRYEGMSTGDSVVVKWAGASAYDTPAQVVGGNVELLFNVPKAYINASNGQSASVSYSVTRAATVIDSAPLWLKVGQGLTFDPTPVTLAGKIYLLPSYPGLLPAFPANTTVQRVASGGQAPYSYSSSNPKVAQVNDKGLTSVRGKGVATISVTDALGESKSYQVTVTGVIHCHGVGSGSLSQVMAAAAALGASIPGINQLHEIYNAYGNRWPMGNANYWSTTVAAQNLVGMKWYFVKNMVTGANFKLLHHNASLGVAVL
jgi:hypothetical protein